MTDISSRIEAARRLADIETHAAPVIFACVLAAALLLVLVAMRATIGVGE